MAWIESHTTLREHPKRRRLTRLLGINVRETIGLLHVLWWWALDFAPEGDLSGFSDADIADSIDWEGDAYALMTALEQSGFIDRDRRIHDWDEFAEKWIARRRANAERMRVVRSHRNGAADIPRATHVADTSGARAPQKSKSVGLPDQPDRTNLPTGPDRTGPTGPDQPTPTPQPPPPAGEGERRNPRGRRGSGSGEIPGEPTAPPSEAPPAADVMLAPPTDTDLALWQIARGLMAGEVSEANYDLVCTLEPAGRGADGGLRLRAPPAMAGLGRFRPIVARALYDAGDTEATHAAILDAKG